MFSRVVAKLFLTATALAPVFPMLALCRYISGKNAEALAWIAVFVLLLLLFRCCLCAIKTKHTVLPSECVQICPADGEPIAFLLAYTLPFIADPEGLLGKIPVLCLFIAICGVCVYFSNAWTFNPVLNIAGYHFYQVRIGESVPLILISKKIIREPHCKVLATQIDEYIYFDKED